MKLLEILLFHLLLLIKIVLSDVFKIKKLPARIKSLRRSLDYNNEDSFLENAYGNSHDLNYYYATLYLGPKKRPQTYILDTGSPTTTSPCDKCKNCGDHLNKPYELNDESNIIKCYSNECNSLSSNSCSDKKCAFSISYSEGSRLAGFFNMQKVSFEKINGSSNLTTKSFVVPIGCTTTETHLFVTQLADGIMGLNNSGKSFVSLLYQNKIISRNLFTICLAQNDGYFSIGEIDTTYHKGEIKYVPLISGENNYYIDIKKISIGNKSISSENYRGFIDSGTTISYFPKEIYNSIINKFNSICKNQTNCGKFEDVSGMGYCGFFKTVEQKQKAIKEYWPDIIFYFNGYNYVLTGNDYYYDYTDERIGACLGFEGESTSKITLGGTFMHGHDIIFDKEKQRIGFTVADCNRGNNNYYNKEDYKKGKYKENEVSNNFHNNPKEEGKIISDTIILYIFIFFSIILVIILLAIMAIIFKRFLCKKKYHRQIDESQKKNVQSVEVKPENSTHI